MLMTELSAPYITKGGNMPTEIERRFLVSGIDLSPLSHARQWHITQGYFELPDPRKSFRVRIVDDGDGTKRAFLAIKEGAGLSRDEKESEILLQQGQDLLAICWHTIQKTRFFSDGWEVDFYGEPLKGLIIAEYEMSSPTQEVVLPLWIYEAVEVTESITNLHLARLATELRAAPETTEFFLHEELLKASRRILRIVLTGGPCSGKSTMLEVLRREFGETIHCVPETASIIISQVGIKPVGHPLALSRFQDTVYRVQRIFEGTSLQQAANEGKHALVLDRGSIDNAAYLTGGLLEMSQRFSTTPQTEYARYDLVLCLDVPPENVFEASKGNNPARSETYPEAVALGERIKQVWGEHPNFRVVPNGQSWQEKQETALGAIRSFLATHPGPS